MPGFYAHYLLGNIGWKQMSIGTLKNSIQKHQGVYTLGQQGPDIFFYYIMSIRALRYRYGSRMHKIRTNLYFSNLIEAVNQETGQNRAIAEAYLAGALGHYVLDANCHPYVYSIVSLEKKREIYGRHTALESDMDMALLMKYKKKRPSQTRIHLLLSMSKEEKEVIARILTYAIGKTYPEVKIAKRNARQAIASMCLMSRILEDPKGWKAKLCERTEKLIWGSVCFAPLFYSDTVYTTDSCNEAHKIWRNPWEESLISSRSVYEMMDSSLLEYHKLARLLQGVLGGQITRSYFLEQFGNRSYHSGLHCMEE